MSNKRYMFICAFNCIGAFAVIVGAMCAQGNATPRLVGWAGLAAVIGFPLVLVLGSRPRKWLEQRTGQDDSNESNRSS